MFKESGHHPEQGNHKESAMPAFLGKCGKIIRLTIIGSSLVLSPELSQAKNPPKTENVDSKGGEKWREAARTGEKLPPLVLESMKYLPKESTLKAENIFAIHDLEKFLVGYLVNKGYDKKIAQETLGQIKGLSEFTLDQELPIFIVIQNNDNYKQFEKVFNQGGDKSPQAAMILASDLWHEEQHAKQDANEVEALKIQIAFLKDLKASNTLTIGDKYIAGQESRLKDEEKFEKNQVSKK